jgi:hypothetical protein
MSEDCGSAHSRERNLPSPNHSGQLLGYVAYSVGSRGTKYTTHLSLVLSLRMYEDIP